MADIIYVEKGTLTSRLLNRHADNIDDAYRALSKIDNYPTYSCAEGKMPLYTQDILSEIQSIQRKLGDISSCLNRYGKILNSGPDELVAVDKSFKSDITTWQERRAYWEECFMVNCATNLCTSINYIIDDYKNKGWIYKGVQSIAAVGRAAPMIIGSAASWAAAPWAPSTWASTAYGVNAAMNMGTDLYNIWNENYDDVGKVNVMKDAMVDYGGDLTEMLCGNEEIGELIGGGIYSVGEIYVSVKNVENLSSLKGGVKTTATDVAFKDKVESKLGLDKFSLKSKVIQTDFNFENIKGAVKEVPRAIKGLAEIAFKSSITEVAKDYKMLTYTIPNIMKTVSTVKLLEKVGKATAELTSKGIGIVSALAN